MFSRMQKAITLICAAAFLLLAGGCNLDMNDVSASIAPPRHQEIPIQGEYKFQQVFHLEEGRFVEETNFRTFTAEFSLAGARIGLERVGEPGYVSKLVHSFDYFLERYRSNPERFPFIQGQMEVLSISSEGQSFYDIFVLNEDEIALVKGNHLIKMVRTDFEKEGFGPLLDTKMNLLENSDAEDLAFEPTAGVLIGLRGPRNEETKESSYRTLWITHDGEVQEVYEVDDLLFPRKEFWKLEVRREEVEGVTKERLNIYAITGVQSNVKEELLYEYPGTFVDVTFLSNNHVGIVYTENGETYDPMEEAMTLAVDGYNSYQPQPIGDFYGEEGELEFQEALFQVVSRNEAISSSEVHLASLYQRFSLKRQHGHWAVEARFKEEEEVYKVPVALRVEEPLVAYDTLTIPWTRIKEQIPQAMDAFNAPGNSFMLVRTPKYLMMYRILGDELSKEPLQIIEIKEREQIVMAEWARGEFVRRWTDVAAREGRKIIFVQNRR